MLLEEKAHEILSSGLDKLSVSLDGIIQEELAHYRINADLKKVLRGMSMLKRERDALNQDHPLIQIQTLMFSYNEIKEGRIVEFLKSLGADRIKLKKPSFDTFGGKNQRSKIFAKTSNNAMGKYSRVSKSYFRCRDRAACRLLFQGFALSDVSVVPCCIDYDGKHPFGNLKNKSWTELWASKKRREFVTLFFSGELDICKECFLGYEYSTTVYDRASVKNQ